ncbi:MAG: hypothetical protein U0939_10295 [Pirellulales bacterium]
MSVSVREHLVGYLLGALDAEEQQQVERALERDSGLRAELERLAQVLPDVELDREHHEPPAGLARRTCLWVSTQVQAEEEVRPTPASLRPAAARESSYGHQWSFADLFVVVGIVVAASFLFLPALSHSRFAAQRELCKNNLRLIGLGLEQYAEMFTGMFPQIPEQGNRSFDGIYLPVLRDNQYLADAHVTGRCPTSPLPPTSANGLATSNLATNELATSGVPTLVEIDRSSPVQMAQVRARAHGGYGYNVGFLQDGRKYVGPRNLRRSTVGLLADAPSRGAVTNRSDNHSGRGQNVLYEDFHIGFIPGCIGDDCPDPIYFNRDGRIALGADDLDTVIVHPETPLEDLFHARR